MRVGADRPLKQNEKSLGLALLLLICPIAWIRLCLCISSLARHGIEYPRCAVPALLVNQEQDGKQARCATESYSRDKLIRITARQYEKQLCQEEFKLGP